MPKPKILTTEKLLDGQVFTVSRSTLDEDGTVYQRDLIAHPGSVVIVPLDENQRVAFVRQYRFPADKYLLEFPAGSLEPGEDVMQGAERELEEEIGVRARRIEPISEFYVSPGFLSEKMFLYLAQDLEAVGQKLEADELIKVLWMTLPEAIAAVSSGEIEDAKTIIGVLLTAAKFGYAL